MTKKLIILIVTALVATSAMAQIPANVREVLKKSEEKMATYNTPAGVSFDATLKMKVSILSLNGTMKVFSKNKKFFTTISMKALKDMEIKIELGFDGEQEWTYESILGEKDSLKITKTKDAFNDYGMRTDYEKDYNKAKMKETDQYYEITFTGRKRKDVSKKATVKIAKNTYLLREYSVDEDMGAFTGKMIITINKITKGCSDNWLKLDMNRYKNAKVVRK